MTHRVRLIFNVHAHRGRAWETASTLRSVVARYPEAEWTPTEYPSHATELARQATGQGYDVVAAIGGDGTVNQVINGLMRFPPERPPALASVPIGPGNDFSSAVGISPDSSTAMHRVFTGTPRWIDLGQVTDGSGRTQYFGNALGIGFDANVTFHSYRITYLHGFSIYLWAVIQTIILNHDAPRMSLTIDGQQTEEEALLLTFCNGRREGGGFVVAPDAVPDDGLLHYTLIRKVSRPMMFRLIPEVMKGTHGRFKQVRLGTFRQLELKADRPLTIHIDGEVFAGFDSDVVGLKVQVLPAGLQVIV
jgi:diacylglycerol kinase (ATP)